MDGGTICFKNRKNYREWLAFGHMHGTFKAVPGNQRVFVAGKKVKVKHGKR